MSIWPGSRFSVEADKLDYFLVIIIISFQVELMPKRGPGDT